jgi:hypothetical protein
MSQCLVGIAGWVKKHPYLQGFQGFPHVFPQVWKTRIPFTVSTTKITREQQIPSAPRHAELWKT